MAAGKGSGHASVPQQLPAAALHACSARPARAPGPLQEAITLGRQENPPPRLLPCSHAPALQPCQLLAQGDFFFFQAAALVAQAHLTSGLWHPCQGTRPGTASGGVLGPCSLLAPPLPAAPTAAGVRWGQSGPLALCWDPVGSSSAGLQGQGDEEPLLPHRQAHTVLAVRGGCFGAIITPALREAPLSSFSPTCRCMYRPNHQKCGCALGRRFTFSFQPPTCTRLSFGFHHLCSRCHLPSPRRERVDAVFHEQCGARTACTRTGDWVFFLVFFFL